jgi:signal transduction histidine kinase
MNAVDELLKSKLQFFSGMIEIYKDGEIDFELSELQKDEQHSTIYDIPHSGHYFQIFHGNGSRLAKSNSLDELTLPFSYEKALEEKIYYETSFIEPDEPVRILTEYITIYDRYRNMERFFIIQIGESLTTVYNQLKNLRLLMLYSMPVMLVLSVIGGITIISISLRPLRDFSTNVGQIRESSLDRRIEAYKVSKELSELASSFNFMMENIEKAFSQQKTFLADASHELRTPTSVIKSCSEVYLRKERTLDDYKEALQIIAKNAGDMEQIVNKMLTLSRMEHRSYTIRKRDVALCQTLNKIISIVRALANKNTVTVETDLPGEEIIVQGDESALSEAFMNVIENSIKYNRKGGTVSVSLTVKSDEAVIVVRDTGIGIPEASLSRIFERFYRAQNTTAQRSEKFHGAGLGLSIVKETIEAHKGRIDVQSEVGKGSIFTFYLPVKG